MVSDEYAGDSGERSQRIGTGSNGAVSPVERPARDHLHDVVHHLYDVNGTT